MAKKMVIVIHPLWKVEAGIVEAATERITVDEARKRGIVVM